MSPLSLFGFAPEGHFFLPIFEASSKRLRSGKSPKKEKTFISLIKADTQGYLHLWASFITPPALTFSPTSS
jgi:hypothetical protein